MTDTAFSSLEAEFCPPLDPALLFAIISDYDLSNDNGVQEARRTLEELKASALLEEAAGFDPSGTGAAAENERGPGKARSELGRDTSGSLLSQETDLTSLSNGVASLDLERDHEHEGGAERRTDEELETLDDETKIQLLQDVFGDHVNQYTVSHTLKKCKGSWNTAMEELLNQVYLSEAGSDGDLRSAKGIDAFLGDDNQVHSHSKGKRKRKNHARGRETSSLPATRNGSPIPASNKWKSASEDIDFVSSRTGVTTAAVASLYYEKSASVPQTIGALLKASMEESKLVVTDDSAVSQQAAQLGQDFPTIAPQYLTSLVRLTFPDRTSALELATALTTRPKQQENGGIQIIPHFAPFDDNTHDWTTGVARSPRLPPTHLPSCATDSPSSISRDSYALARATAFAQARAAHRKAKSDRLMSGAAAYYSQVGREYSALSSAASAAAADALAARQASSTQLDLHGIDVLNAVRLAEQYVQGWWQGLGEKRLGAGRFGAEERREGFRVVVGKGTHSEGGKGKLGPAVRKALVGSGWRVENEGAVLVVRGKARA